MHKFPKLLVTFITSITLFGCFFTLFIINSEEADARTDIRKIERISGANLCSNGEIKDGEKILGLLSATRMESDKNSITRKLDHIELRKLVVTNFDAPEARCLDMSFLGALVSVGESRNLPIKRNSGYYNHNGKMIPLIVSRSEKFESYERKSNELQIFVRVPGGPGSANLISLSDLTIEIFENELVIDFFYTGNGFNILYPTANFQLAANQLADFLIQLRANNRDAKINLVGESLGAVIVLEAIRQIESKEILDQSKVDNIILISPPFLSLKETKERLYRIFYKGTSRNQNFLYRVRDPNKGYNEYGSLTMLDSMAVFEQFYDPGDASFRLIERLMVIGNRPPTLIIYGDVDERIGVELADDLHNGPIDKLRVFRIEGMAHQPSDGRQLTIIRDEIASFIGS
jgi:pimeloyl-ACP methyl ester carboxylesterase